MSEQKTCPCGWLLPLRWSINIHFGDEQEEVVELPDGADDDSDDMKVSVEMSCPQCGTLHFVEPDGLDVDPIESVAN